MEAAASRYAASVSSARGNGERHDVAFGVPMKEHWIREQRERARSTRYIILKTGYFRDASNLRIPFPGSAQVLAGCPHPRLKSNVRCASLYNRGD